jgi:Zn-dependent M28 family amino/carboxypeptidase
VTRPLLEPARLLEGRSNAERQALVAGWLAGRGWPFTRHPYRSLEGSGENYALEVGAGPRTLLLIGHHDAVAGSPGANDNGSAVAILLEVAERLLQDPPRRVRVRLLFTGSEEVGFVGARCYAAETPLDGVLGVLSLELCGIGDSLAVWDAPPPLDQAPFLRAFAGALEDLGYRRDETYHIVGQVPGFGSDHRAFAPLGVPAAGLTVVPQREAERLREFIFDPVARAAGWLLSPPVPFDTYHTPRDRLETLDPRALARTADALVALAHAA